MGLNISARPTTLNRVIVTPEKEPHCTRLSIVNRMLSRDCGELPESEREASEFWRIPLRHGSILIVATKRGGHHGRPRFHDSSIRLTCSTCENLNKPDMAKLATETNSSCGYLFQDDGCQP